MQDIKLLVFLAFLMLCAFVFYKISKKFKSPKVNCVSLVTGGVKTGKSTFAVYLAISNYKRIHKRWKFRAYFQRKLGREIDEEPLLYSNIPLSVPYVPLSREILRREVRPRYKSVCYVNEASLVADSQMFRDMELNERLMLFNKLFGHETLGGMCIYDTQCIVDLHYSIRRCLSEYFYIHHLNKFIPFFLVAEVREERYCEDNSSINTYENDVEDHLKKVIIPKSIWKKFDAYCFSYLTDDLPVADNVIVGAKDLKAKDIVSFREFKTLEVKNEYDCRKKVDSERVQADCKSGMEESQEISKSESD